MLHLHNLHVLKIVGKICPLEIIFLSDWGPGALEYQCSKVLSSIGPSVLGG